MVKFIKKRWIWLLLALLIIGGIVYQSINSANASKKKKSEYTIKKEDLSEVLSLSGKIDAQEKVILRFQSSGKLTWVGVKEGDYIKKYQGIASLDQRQMKKTLEKYLYDYSKERNDFEEDMQKTYPSGAVTDTIKRILEKNQYDLNKAVLDVELQNITLEYSYLYTPIEGVVTRVDAPFPGVNITPAQAEFEIVNPNTLYFSATADQTEIIELRKDMEGKIIFDSFPDDEILGKIIWLGYSPKEDESGTVYEIKLNFSSNKQFRLGMTGDINFTTKERKDIIAIPTTYIKKDKKGSYVMVEEKSIPKKRYIKTNGEIDSKTEVKSGLSVGEKIYD